MKHVYTTTTKTDIWYKTVWFDLQGGINIHNGDYKIIPQLSKIVNNLQPSIYLASFQCI